MDFNQAIIFKTMRINEELMKITEISIRDNFRCEMTFELQARLHEESTTMVVWK
jgi:hypothetical protein